MNEACAAKLRKTHTLVWLFLGMLVYKFSMDLGYLYSTRVSDYVLRFNPLKYAQGLVFCVVLFPFIQHTERRASSFFLYFIFLFQIVPITTVYALGDRSAAYYTLLCLCFFLCELIVGYTGDRPLLRRNFPVSRAMTLCCAAGTLALILYVVAKNGAPRLSLLNIYTVYEYRRSGVFQAGKYMKYLLGWTVDVFLPFGAAKALADRRYGAAGLALGGLVLLYLYTGMKGFLFSAPFILACTLWARRKNCYQEMFLTGCGGFSIMTALAYFTKPGSLWYRLFGLFGDRTMLLAAQLKFDYYDYFLTRPKLGLAAVFPRWLINIPNPYAEVAIDHEIGAIYYDAPQMGANTGFFAEGNMRFGPVGTVLVLLLLALLLKQMDRFQDRAGYELAIGLFITPILYLADLHLLDSLVLGDWNWLAFILLFYIPRHMPPEPPALRLERRRLDLRPPRLRC